MSELEKHGWLTVYAATLGGMLAKGRFLCEAEAVARLAADKALTEVRERDAAEDKRRGDALEAAYGMGPLP